MTDLPTKPNVRKPFVDEVSPDSLMGDFRGRPFVAILAFTVIVHAVLIGVFSFGYLKNQVLGEDTSSLSEEERMDIAVREATSSLRDIAERHGVSPQDLSDRFSAGGLTTNSNSTSPPDTAGEQDAPADGDDTTPEGPQSAIEKELQETKDGPELPDLPSIEDEDDLF